MALPRPGLTRCCSAGKPTGLLASAMIWVGAWDLLSDEARGVGSNETGHVLFDKEMETHVGHYAGGTLLTIFCDTRDYAGAGVDSAMNPRGGVIPVWMRWWQRGLTWEGRAAWDEWNRRARHTLRGVLSYTGMFMLWVGIYNFLDDERFIAWPVQRDWGYTRGGVGLLVVTDTFYCMAGVFPPQISMIRHTQVYETPGDTPRCAVAWRWAQMWAKGQGLAFARCFVSLVGQNMIWCGMYGL